MRVRYATVKNSKGVSATFMGVSPGIDWGPRQLRPDSRDGDGGLKESSGVRSLLALRSLDADFAEVGDEVGGPAVDVVFENDLAHARHQLTLLLFTHFKRLTNGTGKLVHVIGIYEQRVAQLLGRAGETAQDKRAAIVFAGGDKFLGHKVHAVVERGDQAYRGCAIEAGNLFVRMVALQKNDRFPAAGLEARVDAVGFDAHFLQKLPVTRDVGTAGSANLDEAEPLKVRGKIFK